MWPGGERIVPMNVLFQRTISTFKCSVVKIVLPINTSWIQFYKEGKSQKKGEMVKLLKYHSKIAKQINFSIWLKNWT